MPKKPYTGSYKKRASSGSPKGNAGLGTGVPPVQYNANQIASPNESGRFMKKGAKNSRPNMRR